MSVFPNHNCITVDYVFDAEYHYHVAMDIRLFLCIQNADLAHSGTDVSTGVGTVGGEKSRYCDVKLPEVSTSADAWIVNGHQVQYSAITGIKNKHV